MALRLNLCLLQTRNTSPSGDEAVCWEHARHSRRVSYKHHNVFMTKSVLNTQNFSAGKWCEQEPGRDHVPSISPDPGRYIEAPSPGGPTPSTFSLSTCSSDLLHPPPTRTMGCSGCSGGCGSSCGGCGSSCCVPVCCCVPACSCSSCGKGGCGSSCGGSKGGCGSCGGSKGGCGSSCCVPVCCCVPACSCSSCGKGGCGSCGCSQSSCCVPVCCQRKI